MFITHDIEILTQLEDSKKTFIQHIDELDNQKEWVDWISKYGEDIKRRRITSFKRKMDS